MRFLFFTLFLAACASAPTQKDLAPTAAAIPPEKPADPPAPRVVEPEEEASPFRQESSLRETLSRYIASHPEKPISDIANMGNRLMRKYGYPLVIDAAPLLKKDKSLLRLRAGKKIFEFAAGAELSKSEDICGERFLRIPARITGRHEAALISEGKPYAFSLKGFRRDQVRIFRDEKLVASVQLPEPAEPIGVTKNGKGVYLKFPLNDSILANWWQAMGEELPGLMDEDPYLLLTVEADRIYFEKNAKNLPAQEFEVDESDNTSFRWRFQPSNLVLELSSKCS